MSQRPSPARLLAGILTGVISGAAAMFLLSTLVAGSLALALAIAVVVAGAGGAAASPLLSRGPRGANFAGLSTLAGVMLLALPLSGAGSALSATQIFLFGFALAFVSAMGGQVTAPR